MNIKTFTWGFVTLVAIMLYGCQEQDLPLVRTISVTDISANSMLAEGEIMEKGGSAIVARGFVWSSNVNPSLKNHSGVTDDIAANGVFYSRPENLSPNTKYYIRAYASNVYGTAYGDEISFQTTAHLPSVITTPARGITHNSALIGGMVIYDGGNKIKSTGVAFSETENLVIETNQITEMDDSGEFELTISDLKPGKVYYARAFTTNSAGMAYGNQVSFETLECLPIVLTNDINVITHRSAITGGQVNPIGEALITDKGIVYGTTSNPTIDDKFVSAGTGAGSFSTVISDLHPATDYFVRAYAVNSAGIAYGNQQQFLTQNKPDVTAQSCPSMPFFIDLRDGNSYPTVQIGSQCWMGENLKYLPVVNLPKDTSLVLPRYYVYNYNGNQVVEAKETANYNNYGVLYNWNASLSACPPGWHLPTTDEWSELLKYLEASYGIYDDNETAGVVKALKSCRQVNSVLGGNCHTNEHPRWDSHHSNFGYDHFGFSALPAGFLDSSGFFSTLGQYGGWWSATEFGWEGKYAHGRHIRLNENVFIPYSLGTIATGMSIRCLMDN